MFFTELGLARPERELGIGGGSNTSQTARMLAALEPLLAQARPDAALVYGDTNSTLAGALAAAQATIPVVHVEAGMRSFDRTMPEELNRVLIDHLSELLLCSTQAAVENLRAESLAERSRARRRRDGRRRPALAARRARRRRGAAPATGWRPAPTCCSPPTAPATSTGPSAYARSSTS